MSGSWTKLRKHLYKVLRPGVELRLEIYRMKTQYGNTNIPHFQLFDENKREIWKHPDKNNSNIESRKDKGYGVDEYYKDGSIASYLDHFPYMYYFPSKTESLTITDIFRKYINTPKSELKNLTDPWGLYAALRSLDRRIKQ